MRPKACTFPSVRKAPIPAPFPDREEKGCWYGIRADAKTKASNREGLGWPQRAASQATTGRGPTLDYVALRPEEEGLATNEDVIRQVAGELHARGYVRDEYTDAVVARERTYPTGLELGGGVSVAIPHTEAVHVIKSAIAVAPLPHPVDWHLLADPEHTAKVSLVVMLAVADPRRQVDILRKLMGLLQDADLVGRILSAQTVDEVRSLFVGGFE